MSEKTFRPFYSYQLPIFVSSYNHVNKIKELYPSLDLFEDFINHDYDNESDDTKRLEMIVQEIKRLSEMKNEIIEFYKKNKIRFYKNREYVESFADNVSTLNYLDSLINNTL